MVVLLDNIRSLYNVGSIFRTADAAGVQKVYLCGITPGPLDRFGKIRPQFAKVSLGAEKTIAWGKYSSASCLINKLKKDEYKVFAVEQDEKSVPYYTLRPTSPALERSTLVFGNEVKGISRPILKKADKILEIPMYGSKESLNVAVSAGVVLFHLRQAIEAGK